MQFAPVEGAATLFTPAFCDYLTRLHDQLDARARDLRARRLTVLERALHQRIGPTPRPTSSRATCPSCMRRLKERCYSCSKPIDPTWKICPFCEAETATTPTPRASRRRRRSTEQPTEAEAPPT